MLLDQDITASFYKADAEGYFARTVGTDMSRSYERFLRYVPAGGAILDAGCGSGRDARCFREKGYRVTAMEPVENLARLAEAHTGQPVLRLRFQQMAFVDEFDGIWASASLLHVGRSEIEGVFQQMIRALHVGGTWYMSFRRGDDEGIAHGRFYSNYTLDSLAELLSRFAQVSILEIWEGEDTRPNRQDIVLVHAIVRRTR